MPQVILASQSPRRRELLKNIITDYQVIPSDADETMPDCLSPADCAVEIARRKAFDIKGSNPDCLVIGADTIVVYEDKILGKPRDEEDAFNMLSLLSGKTHTVYTGVVATLGDKTIAHAEGTRVTFRDLSCEMIRNYISTGEPMDKAGAYGIQEKGSLLVERIEGDYFNVVGLPVCKLAKMLSDLGISVL